MNVQSFVTDFFESNTYLFSINGYRFMIDCGGTPEYVATKLNAFEFEPEYILLTHGHIDHILALPTFVDKAKVFVHSDDMLYLKDPSYNLSSHLIGRPISIPNGVTLYDQLPREFGIEVISTPGHTPGSVCLLVDGCLFSGDTLFSGGIGNTAFPGGDYSSEVASVQRLLSLPPDVRVYPGHGPTTTIGRERNLF